MPEVVVEEEEEVAVEEEIEEKVILICELRRTSCYGKCPSYSIKLYSDGSVNYHGKANVEKLGHYSAYCNPQSFEAIFAAANVANYFVLRSQYPTDGRVIPDLPKTISYLKREGLEKRVIDNFEAPPSLIKFEKWLDNFFDDLTWEKVSD